MKINVLELRKITERLLDHLQEGNAEFVELPVDLYWDIPEDHCYNLNAEPTKFTVGQLSDDWGILREVLEQVYEPVTFNFVNLAAIFRAIGEKSAD